MAIRSGFLDQDSNGNQIQFATYALPRDGNPSGNASASNVWSPQALATGSALSLVAPNGAIELYGLASVNAWTSTDASAGSAGTSAAHGFLCSAGSWNKFPVKGGSTITVLASGAAGVFYYFFNMLNSSEGYTSTINS